MPRVGFEHTIPVLERAKTVHALNREATGIGDIKFCLYKMSRDLQWGIRPHEERDKCDHESNYTTQRE
jgi:hypothetical protein